MDSHVISPMKHNLIPSILDVLLRHVLQLAQVSLFHQLLDLGLCLGSVGLPGIIRLHSGTGAAPVGIPLLALVILLANLGCY